MYKYFDFPNQRGALSRPGWRAALALLIGVLHFTLWRSFSVISMVSDASSRASSPAIEKRMTVIWITGSEHSPRVVSPSDLSTLATKELENMLHAGKKNEISHKYAKRGSNLIRVKEASESLSAPVGGLPSSPTSIASEGAKDVTGASSPKFDYSKVAASLKSFEHDFSVSASSGSVLRESSTEKLGREISKAKRGNCETTYSHLGLLAIPLLVRDAMTEKGCKW